MNFLTKDLKESVFVLKLASRALSFFSFSFFFANLAFLTYRKREGGLGEGI